MNVYDPNTPEGRKQIRRRDERREKLVEARIILTLILSIVTIFALDFIGNELWYGDWECAFVNCVRVQDIKKP